MKIIENNSTRLVLRGIPILQVIFGLSFVLSGLAIPYFLGRSIDIHCERAVSKPITCDMEEKLLGMLSLRQYTIASLEGAEVEVYTDSDGDTYKVIFLTANGQVPLTGYSSSGYRDKAELVEQINGFIDSERQEALDLQVAAEWWILIFFFGFTGGGVAVIGISKTVRVEMDRLEGVLRVRTRGFFGQQEQTYLLREIKAADLEYNDDASRIVFHTASNETIPLSNVYTSGIGDNKKRVLEAINDFLAPYRQPQDQAPFS